MTEEAEIIKENLEFFLKENPRSSRQEALMFFLIAELSNIGFHLHGIEYNLRRFAIE